MNAMKSRLISLGTGLVALAVVGARAEEALHGLDHGLGALPTLGLALGQHVEVGQLGRGEQLSCRVRTRRHTGTAADTGSRIHGEIRDFLRDRYLVGVGRGAGRCRDVAGRPR